MPYLLSMTQQRAALVFVSILLTCISGVCVAQSVTGAENEIDRLMSALEQRGQFNGAILVAKNGAVLYKKGFGKANYRTGLDFTTETPSNIGSLTKQFTAMAIMMLALWEKAPVTRPDARPELIR